MNPSKAPIDEVFIRKLGRQCTMIWATLLLSYLLACCSSGQRGSFGRELGEEAAAAAAAAAARRPAAGQQGGGQAESARQQQQQQQQHDLHKLMSEQDLRRTFQVDSHDQVPEYEILKLEVSDDGSHLISPISDLGELTRTGESGSEGEGGAKTKSGPRRGEESGASRAGAGASLAGEFGLQRVELNAEANSARNKRSVSLNQTSRDRSADAKATGGRQERGELGAPTEGRRRRRRREEEEEQLIVMKLSTFGRDFKLRLRRNADFQQRIKDMKMFMAESTGDGQLRYTEIKGQPSGGSQRQVSATAESCLGR